MVNKSLEEKIIDWSIGLIQKKFTLIDSSEVIIELIKNNFHRAVVVHKQPYKLRDHLIFIINHSGYHEIQTMDNKDHLLYNEIPLEEGRYIVRLIDSELAWTTFGDNIHHFGLYDCHSNSHRYTISITINSDHEVIDVLLKSINPKAKYDIKMDQFNNYRIFLFSRHLVESINSDNVAEKIKLREKIIDQNTEKLRKRGIIETHQNEIIDLIKEEKNRKHLNEFLDAFIDNNLNLIQDQM